MSLEFSLFLTVLILAALALASWLAAKFGPGGAYPDYRSRGALLTPAEQRFHSALRESLPPHVNVCFKVRLADVIACRKGEYKQRAQNKINQKHLDFVLVHAKSSRIIAAIELDDASHRAEKRIERDKFLDHALASAQVRLVRIPAAGHYDPAHLAATLRLNVDPIA